MYSGNEAYTISEGKLSFLFSVKCGVLQGCPLSAVLFNFAMDPFLWICKRLIKDQGLGKVLACADDIGASLCRFRLPIPLHSAFTRFQRISGLTLHSKKCVLILDSCVASKTNIDRVKSWLSRNIPDWIHISVVNASVYLGIHLGPSATKLQWLNALMKFNTRVESLRNSGEAAAFCLREFNTRVLPVLLYISQLILPPENIQHIEIVAAQKVLHFATNSFSAGTLLCWAKDLGVRFRSISISMRACMIRCALNNIENIRPMARELREIAIEHLPWGRVIDRPCTHLAGIALP